MKKVHVFLMALAVSLAAGMSPVLAQTGDWIQVGITQGSASPYDFYFYKLLQVNANTHRYATIIDVSVQGDANYYSAQGTYRIRVDKYENTTDRFDGLEIQCISGNCAAAIFYIYNNALWVRSNAKWGHIYYRTFAAFTSSSPLNATPFGQTTTAPTGYATTAVNGSIKCDFDNNQYYHLPSQDVNGNAFFYKNVGLAMNSAIGMGFNDTFTYDSKTHPHYGLQWTMDSWNASPSLWLSAYGGLKFFTAGTPKMVIAQNGNVGIGTTAPGAYKLAVEGTIGARKVKVTQAAWADFVFDPRYRLRSLPELEAYILAHQHLPDVPAEKEVLSDGLDLGDMNKRLLQKIEELTLYLIEEHKEKEAQLEMIRSLKKEVEELRTEVRQEREADRHAPLLQAP
ncbi:hypothetical protein [Chitinophaga japonensis]|uniref:Uncharacterized protein n=1 Tax=Chitinophaga japonensis TaxID=104662 RepID=A0A562T0H6_CHIJA|nr:hypothetical protein [Chitinophaga japonensis]TWI86764.1 hypothetical protein LX66_4028 [Chitinophaga japonensis]